MRFETLACNVNICILQCQVVDGPARVCGHLEAVREKDVPLVHKHRGEGGGNKTLPASSVGHSSRTLLTPPLCWQYLQRLSQAASRLRVWLSLSPGVNQDETEVINCPPLTDDNTGPPGPGHTDVDPPGLGEEAELPGVVGPDHAQDDHLLLPALVAVHSPHLHPAQALRLPQQAPAM